MHLREGMQMEKAKGEYGGKPGARRVESSSMLPRRLEARAWDEHARHDGLKTRSRPR